MYDIRFDPKTGVLNTVTKGFWTLEVAQTFERDLDRAMVDARTQWGYLLLLVDARESAVQSAEVIQSQAELEHRSICSNKDRVAVIVASSLVKMQAQRVITTGQMKIFLSISEAETWLAAHEPAAYSSGKSATEPKP